MSQLLRRYVELTNDPHFPLPRFTTGRVAHHHLYGLAAAAAASNDYGHRGILEPHGGLPFAAIPVVYEFRLPRRQVDFAFEGRVGPIPVAVEPEMQAVADVQTPNDGDGAIGLIGQLIKAAWGPLSGWLMARLLNVALSASVAVDSFFRVVLVGAALFLAGKVLLPPVISAVSEPVLAYAVPRVGPKLDCVRAIVAWALRGLAKAWFKLFGRG